MKETEIDTWAIVELMGHDQVAGKLSGGPPLLRLDVPACGDVPAFTQWLGAGSIFRITAVSEEIAKEAVKRFDNVPVSVFRRLHTQPALPSMYEDVDDYE